MYRPANYLFLLKNSNSTGFADEVITFNPAPVGHTLYPVVGDWTAANASAGPNGQNVDTPGIYDSTSGTFYLHNSNTNGTFNTAYETFQFGNPGDTPLAGRWTAGNTTDGIGVYRSSSGLILLRNELSAGFAEDVLTVGIPGDRPIVGDWNGGPTDSIGVYRPSNSQFLMASSFTSNSASLNISFTFGSAGSAYTDIVGNWTNSPTWLWRRFIPSRQRLVSAQEQLKGFLRWQKPESDGVTLRWEDWTIDGQKIQVDKVPFQYPMPIALSSPPPGILNG